MSGFNNDDREWPDKNGRFFESFDYEDSTDYENKLSAIALLWAQENLPEPEYKAIAKSYDSIMKKTLIFLLAFFVPLSFAVFSLPFLHPLYKVALKLEVQNMPEGATQRVVAHKNEKRGTVYWYDGGALYSRPFDETGLDPDDYKDRYIVLYVDNSQNIVGVKTGFNAENVKEIEAYLFLMGVFPLPIALLFINYFYIRRTSGKLWITFFKEWRIKKEARRAR